MTTTESQQARGTHSLSSAKRGTGQDSERNTAKRELGSSAPPSPLREPLDCLYLRISSGHLLSVERRAKGWSGQRRKVRKQGALTFCRAQREGLVRTAKETQQARGTHCLSSAERGTGQDSERNAAIERHSLPVERRARDWPGRQKKYCKRGALTACRAQGEGLVRTAKETLQARGTHYLSSAERRSGQDIDRKSASEGHSPSVERRARNWLGRRKKPSQ
jgi:hypothetical protein